MPFKLLSVEDEYKKHKEIDKESIKALQEWIKSQPHLPTVTELQLIIFFHSCYFSTQVTKDTIDNFYTVKTHCPEMFGNRNPKAVIKRSVGMTSILPKLTPEGYRIVYIRVVDPDSNKLIYADEVKRFDMVMMSWLNQHGTDNGLIILYDLDLSTLSHLGKISLLIMKKLFYYLHEAFPVRLKGLHFINVVPFMDKILALIKPFMKKELIEMMIFHPGSFETLYKYVPKDCLPKDLGGSADCIKDLHEQMKKILLDSEDFYQTEEKQKVDESKRPGKPKDVGTIFGIEGSFKKLEID